MRNLFSAFIGTLLLTACTAANPGDQQSSTISSLNDLHPMITVDNPTPNQLVTSPLTVTGQARGPWYFEASFPLKLTDEAGNLIVRSHAEAQGDWMTGDFVTFTSTLSFTTTAKSGFLVLQNDNPSGLPENDDSISIPVKFTADACVATCPDGYEYRTCTEDGHVINYFADPCLNHGVPK